MSKRKASRQARGYGAAHIARRRALEPYVRSGRAVCTRCGQPIAPGEQWHLDHTDDRTGYNGPSHARCNLAAAAAKTNEIKALKREKSRQVLRWSREWFVPEPGTVVDYGNGRIVEY